MLFLYVTGKAFFFYIVTEIIFAAWLILAILEPTYRPRRSIMLLSFLIVLLVTAISNWLGVNPTLSFLSNFERMDGYIMLVHVFLFTLVTGSLLRHRINWSVYFHTIIAASLVMVIISFKQILKEGFDFRIDTTIGNPIYLAAYMLFASFMTLWLIAQLKKDTFKAYATSALFWIYTIIWILQISIVFQTQTRGAALGLAAGLLVMSALIAWRAKDNKPARLFSIGVIVVTFVAAGSLYLARNTDFVKSVPFLERLTTISATSGTGQARLWNWSIAWQGVKERPWLGWGQNNYSQVFNTYYEPRMYEQEPWFDRTHNIVLEWFISGGIIGLLAYLSLLISAAWLVWKTTSMSELERSVTIGLLSAYFVQNLFVFDHPVSYVLFATVLAYIYSQTATEYDWLQRISYKGRELWLVCLILVALPFVLMGIHSAPMSAAQNVVKGMNVFTRDAEEKLVYMHPGGLQDNIAFLKQSLAEETSGMVDIRSKLVTVVNTVTRVKNVPTEDVAALIAFTEQQLLAEIERNPHDVRFHYMLSSIYAEQGQAEKAIQILDKALEVIPNKQLFIFLKARFLLLQGKGSEAIVFAKSAYELAPELQTAWIQYVTVLALADTKLFEQEMKYQMSIGNYDRVETFLLESINRNSKSVIHYVSLAAFYFQKQDKDESLRVINIALERFPDARPQLQKLKTEIENGGNPLGKDF